MRKFSKLLFLGLHHYQDRFFADESRCIALVSIVRRGEGGIQSTIFDFCSSPTELYAHLSSSDELFGGGGKRVFDEGVSVIPLRG